MSVLNEVTVLNYYLDKMDKDEIQFLKNRDNYKEKIKELILALRNEKIIHNKIEISKDLWKILFESAMSYIDPDKRGYDDLFKYFDKYVKFEELIFASDSFYRDHTMHCLWVYFLGEYIVRQEEYEFIVSKMDDHIKRFKILNNVFKEVNKFGLFTDISQVSEKFLKLEDYADSVRCIVAITHDLGYPIKKINKINKSMKDILPYFSIYNYDEFNFSYTEIQQKYIEEFVDILSFDLDFNIIADKTKKGTELFEKIIEADENGQFIGVKIDVLKQFTKEEMNSIERSYKAQKQFQKVIDNNLKYLTDFEQYNHGIMSAYLLIKNIESFGKLRMTYSNLSDIKMDNSDFVNTSSKLEILRAITDHTSKSFQISKIENSSSFLVLIDELEEFSRISRANQNRQYINEFCKTNIYTQESYLRIDFTFDNTDIDDLDPELAFKGRCKRFLNLFRIFDLDEDLKIKLRCIGKLPYDENTYELEIRRKYANITINGEEKDIPKYLKSNQFYSKEEYMSL